MADKKSKKDKPPESVPKHFKFGMEFELFTLDKNGYMTDGGERLIKRVKDMAPEVDLVKEMGQSMVELRSRPYKEVPDMIKKMLEDFEAILYSAEKEDLIIYPYATYPGTHSPNFTKSRRYEIMINIANKQRMAMFTRTCSMHYHFTLPWGVFDNAKKFLKHLVRSKHKDSLVNIYNLYIAMDPALTTFAQSSPFYQGKRIGKDARVISLRGGEALDCPKDKYEEFFALQEYDHTSTDLIHGIQKRFDQLAQLLRKINLQAKALSKYGSMLSIGWNPIRVTAHGTMEQRSMDINSPQIIASLALLIKHISKLIQEEFVQVVPSDMGIEEPFKREGNIIYIPPDSYVRLKLQKKAAYKGLEDDEIYRYCSGLLKLAKSCIPEHRLPFLKPLEEMLEKRETVSDRIITEAKKIGANVKEGITDAEAAKLALELSKNLFKEIVMLKQTLNGLNET